MNELAFPYAIAPFGRSATSEAEDHVKELVEQFLLTAPGERVNRPTFGSGMMQLVFAPNSEALAATVQATMHGALQQWLGDRIDVESVTVASPARSPSPPSPGPDLEAFLQVDVAFRVRLTQQSVTARFQRSF